MRSALVPAAAAVLLLPALVFAQASTGSSNSQSSASNSASATASNSAATSSGASASPAVRSITSVFTSIGVGANHQETTIVGTTVVLLTLSPAAGTPGPSAAPSSSKPTTPSNLPTAPANVDGGGQGTNGAPSPGASGSGGIYGPPDGFTAAAVANSVNLLLVGGIGVAIGGLAVMA